MSTVCNSVRQSVADCYLQSLSGAEKDCYEKIERVLKSPSTVEWSVVKRSKLKKFLLSLVNKRSAVSSIYYEFSIDIPMSDSKDQRKVYQEIIDNIKVSRPAQASEISIHLRESVSDLGEDGSAHGSSSLKVVLTVS